MNFFEALCDVVEKTSQPGQVVKNEAYSITTAGALKFEECGDELFVAQFASIHSGILRMGPGGFKKRAMTKDSPLKFFVLQGEIEVACSGDVFRLKTFSHLEVMPGSHYSLKNVSKEDAFIQFTRDLSRSPDKKKEITVTESEKSHETSNVSSESTIEAPAKPKGGKKVYTSSSSDDEDSKPLAELAGKKICKPKHAR